MTSETTQPVPAARAGGGRHRRGPSRARRVTWVAFLVTAFLVTGPSVGVLLWSGTPPTTTERPDPPPPMATSNGTTSALDPRSYPPGVCMLATPRPSEARSTVVLDAGHGGPDPGAIGTSAAGRPVREKDLTLAVAAGAARDLRALGFDVVVTRSTDVSTVPIGDDEVRDGALTAVADRRQLAARVRCANQASAAVLVSVHFNSFDDPAVRGTETVYEMHRSLAPASGRLARSVHDAARARLAAAGAQAPDRGLVDDSIGGESTGSGSTGSGSAGNGSSGGDHLVLLGPRVPGYIEEATTMPAALIEPAFLTNTRDATIMATADGTGALAAAVVNGITRYVDGETQRDRDTPRAR